MTYELSPNEQSALWHAVVMMIKEKKEKPTLEEEQEPRTERYPEE